MSEAGPLTRLRFKLSLWLAARSMPARIRGLDLAPLIALYEAGPERPYAGLPAAEIVASVRRVTRHPWTMRNRRCLRQGLLAYRYLTLAGYDPELHFGVDRASVGGAKISAHCWIVLDGKVELVPPSPGMVTVFVHDGKGKPAGNLPPIEAIDRTAA